VVQLETLRLVLQSGSKPGCLVCFEVRAIHDAKQMAAILSV